MRTSWGRIVVIVLALGVLVTFGRRLTTQSSLGGSGSDGVDGAGFTGTNASAPSVGPGSTGAGHGEARGLPPLDREKADRMREQIRALLTNARTQASAAPETSAPAASVAPPFRSMPSVPADGGGTNVDPDYLKNIVARDFAPLAKNCYEGALAKNPELSGKAVIHFEILGDRSVGGVVNDARLVKGTTLDDPEFRTCVTESIMSVAFDAPPENGTLTVTVPMRFTPTREDHLRD
jgi:hypothetical protein